MTYTTGARSTSLKERGYGPRHKDRLRHDHRAQYDAAAAGASRNPSLYISFSLGRFCRPRRYGEDAPRLSADRHTLPRPRRSPRRKSARGEGDGVPLQDRHHGTGTRSPRHQRLRRQKRTSESDARVIRGHVLRLSRATQRLFTDDSLPGLRREAPPSRPARSRYSTCSRTSHAHRRRQQRDRQPARRLVEGPSGHSTAG